MMLHEIKAGKAVRHAARKRVGRGNGSGSGTYCGRGNKGAGQRAGANKFIGEGGNLPFFRRLPKRGFSNFRFRNRFQVINIESLENSFDASAVVDPQALAQVGLIDNATDKVKILGNGKLTKALTVKAHKFSKSAHEAITAAGGTCEVIER